MLRRLHALPGLVLAVCLAFVALTGAVLSVEPALHRLAAPAIERGTSVADLAAAVAARRPGVETIRARADGTLTAAFADAETTDVERIDPRTGAGLGPWRPSETSRLLVDLHRSLLADDAGRLAVAVAALAVLVLTLSGVALLAKRLGGSAALLRPIRGTLAERLHGELGRLAALGLLLSSVTGLWMTASTFGLLPEAATETVVVTASDRPAAPIARLAALRAVDVAALRELVFPRSGEPGDTFRLRADAGEATIDPATGATIAFVPATRLERLGRTVEMLHTGRGAWALGLLLGLSSAAVPVFAATGVAMWLRRRAARPRVTGDVPARSADTVILVGSEGNTTWGFAATLAATLGRAGHRVHTCAMNDLSPAHASARRLLILTATWGDGGAPSSATAFAARLERFSARMPVAVLGFGDRTFPTFCRWAHDVATLLAAKGFPTLMPLKRIDRRSAQEFAQWGRDLGAVLGHDLVLEHVAERPKTLELELIEREDYGAAVGAPVAILRFVGPTDARTARPRRLPDFEAGDLVGILPPGEAMPRFYSLASSTADGVVEICVRLMPGGRCSTFLHGLEPGDRIDAFVRANPSFRPIEGRAPLILIGAGAGIGPLAGFVRANAAERPVHLYWGGRNPASDFLYEHELARHLAERRLTSLRTAFSRDPRGGAYVQDRIAADAPHLRDLIRHGAQVLVCGGRDMAHAVTHTLEAIVRPLGLDLATLRSEGRYVEDVY
ncbi:MAG: PepSY domain-containing protein [Siculibacillus sp.]